MFVFLIAAAVAQASIAPASDANVEAFLAALPPSKDGRTAKQSAPMKLDDGALKDLQSRNPGHEAESRTAFVAYSQCQHDAGERAKLDALQSSARRLGDEKLVRLTAFYRGPDFTRWAAIADKKDVDRTQAEKDEYKRVLSAYPLEDYLASARESANEMWSPDGMFGQLAKCEDAFNASLVKAGLTP
jgi:hypothetical protein